MNSRTTIPQVTLPMTTPAEWCRELVGATCGTVVAPELATPTMDDDSITETRLGFDPSVGVLVPGGEVNDGDGAIGGVVVTVITIGVPSEGAMCTK